MHFLMKKNNTLLSAIFAMLVLGGISCRAAEAFSDLVGAWRGGVQFTTGDFAAVKDLDFMYVFNAGGTLIESSNYDGAPPVPPAYGIWRKIADRKYQAKYSYYVSKAPANLEEITKGGGWSPGGYGVLTQEITLSADGKTFESTIKYETFDVAGKPVGTTSVATATAKRFEF